MPELTANDHANLKIDLGQKLTDVLHEEMVEGLSPSRAVGRILETLEVEATKSFLTKSDAAFLWADISKLVQANGELLNATAQGLSEDSIIVYTMSAAAEHERLKKRIDGLKREGAE